MGSPNISTMPTTELPTTPLSYSGFSVKLLLSYPCIKQFLTRDQGQTDGLMWSNWNHFPEIWKEMVSFQSWA